MNLLRRGDLVGVAVIALAVMACAQTPGKKGDQPAPAPAKPEAVSRVGNSVRVSVSAPRPLEQAIDALRAKFGWVVSYEDPQYISRKDITESTIDKGTLVPAGGAFDAEIPAGESPAETAEAERSLKLVVSAYNQSGNPGQFELRKSDDSAFVVVGVGARDDKGVVVSQKGLLDSTITAPIEQRTIIETVDLVCEKLAKATQLPVAVGVTPRSFVDHTDITTGGTSIPARTILSKALAASGHTLYWRLLFDPNTKSYLLNIHSLSAPKLPSRENKNKPSTGDSHPSIPNR